MIHFLLTDSKGGMAWLSRGSVQKETQINHRGDSRVCFYYYWYDLARYRKFKVALVGEKGVKKVKMESRHVVYKQ